MTTKENSLLPYRPVDIEIWRTKNGLTISMACELLGLQRAKWAEMMQDKERVLPIKDMAVCIMLQFYEDYPETMPINRVIKVMEYMRELGYNPDDPTDKKEFAIDHGREPAATYRWKNDEGRVSKPVARIMEAVSRMDSSWKKRRAALRATADKVAKRNNVPNPYKTGTWSSDQGES